MNMKSIEDLEKRINKPDFKSGWLTVTKIRELVKALKNEKKRSEKFSKQLKERS